MCHAAPTYEITLVGGHCTWTSWTCYSTPGCAKFKTRTLSVLYKNPLGFLMKINYMEYIICWNDLNPGIKHDNFSRFRKRYYRSDRRYYIYRYYRWYNYYKTDKKSGFKSVKVLVDINFIIVIFVTSARYNPVGIMNLPGIRSQLTMWCDPRFS